MKQKILKYKKQVAFLIVYLVFLGWTLHAFSGSPPGNKIEVYKGSFGNGIIATDAKIQEMKECGVNTLRIQTGVFMDSEGNIHELPFWKQLAIQQIQTAHRNGLQAFLDIKNNYGPVLEAMAGKATNSIPEELQPIFFEQYNEKVLECAEIAEKYGVELFSPLHEAEAAFTELVRCEELDPVAGAARASEWMQEILPKIKERYHGKVIWKGGLQGFSPDPGWLCGHWQTMRDEAYINFTGYDYIGFTIWPDNMPPGTSPEDYRMWVRDVIDTTTKWAERDGCEGVIVTEFGLGRYKHPLRIVFEEGEGRLKGYVTWLQTDEYRSELKHWYKEKLP
jgi:hypothetical protein